MEIKKSDCEASNSDLVNKIKPNMPEMGLLYELSDFFKVMGDSTRIQLLWALEEVKCVLGILLFFKHDKICCIASIESFKNSKTGTFSKER